MKKFCEYGTVEGTLPYQAILNAMDGNIKRATEFGSAFSDEYYVIDRKDGVPIKGMYIACSRLPYSCLLKSHEGSSKYFDVSNREAMSDGDFKKTLADLGCDMKKYDSIAEDSTDNTPFEFSIEKDKVRIWLVFNGEGITLELERDPKEPGVLWTSEKFLKTISVQDFKVSSEYSLLDAIESAMAAEREKVVASGIKKITNGYLAGDTYFKTLDEALERTAKTTAKEKEK